MNVLRAYDHLLVARPIITKSLTSAVLFGAGDYLGQYLERRSAAAGQAKPYDIKRTVRMVGWGAAFGVLAHGW